MFNWRQPVDKVKLGSLFGAVDQWHKPPGHRGTDYNGFAAGYPLKAVGDGVIALNKWSDVLGNVVVLQVGKHYFGYCHMLEASPLKVGTKVKSGAVVGKAGNTGSASAGVHLHFSLGLTKDSVFYGKVYDAYTFINKMAASEKKMKAAAAKKAAAAPAVAPVAPVAEAVAPVAAPVAPKKAAPAKIAKPELVGELKKGDEGLAVKYLQQQLKLPITGNFDEVTYAATVTFQHHHPEITKPDGIVGKITWKAIG